MKRSSARSRLFTALSRCSFPDPPATLEAKWCERSDEGGQLLPVETVLIEAAPHDEDIGPLPFTHFTAARVAVSTRRARSSLRTPCSCGCRGWGDQSGGRMSSSVKGSLHGLALGESLGVRVGGRRARLWVGGEGTGGNECDRQ